MLEQVEEWEQEEKTEHESEIQNLSANIKTNEERMDKLVSTYLDGDIPKGNYLKQKDKLMRSLAALEQQKKDFASGRNQWVEPLREWILDTKQAAFLSSSDNFSEIASFVKKVGTNPTVRDKTARFSMPSPSHFVAARQRFLPRAAAALPPSLPLAEREVNFCGPIRDTIRAFIAIFNKRASAEDSDWMSDSKK